MKPYDEFSCSNGSSGIVLPDGKILYFTQCSERDCSTNARLTKRALDGAYCRCKEYINKPMTTALICAFCGKPPRRQRKPLVK